jgi:thiamine biosynthesis lipoprotein
MSEPEVPRGESERVTAATTPLPGLHEVQQIMGTAISLDVRDAFVSPEVLERAFDYLRAVDMRFSTYKPESEVSRLSRGEIAEKECSPELREVLALCEQVKVTTEGYFDIRAHREDGRIDPSGLVKGWALEKAGRILEAARARNYCINGGGDVVARGQAARGRPWRVGIRHPLVADKLATVLTIVDGAVATSGAYERGDHVRDPHTGRPAAGTPHLRRCLRHGRLCHGADGTRLDRGPGRLRRLRDHRRSGRDERPAYLDAGLRQVRRRPLRAMVDGAATRDTG